MITENDPERRAMMSNLGLSEPPMAPPIPKRAGMEICVPSKSVATEDEGENAVAPSEGDEVEMTVRGKVTRVDGDNVYIMPSEVNGEPMVGDMPQEESTPEEDTEETMRAAMGGAM